MSPAPRRRALACLALPLALCLAAIAPYAGTLRFGLVLDDQQFLTSPLRERPFDVLAVWRNGFLAPKFQYLALYRPLSQWSLLLNARVNELLLGARDSGAGFHAVNVLLHAGATLLLFSWLRSLPLRRGVPFLAALLFAVHPVHGEVVASVSARSEPMALTLGLAFLLAHGRGRPWLAGALYLAAMWSKESAVAFLAVAIAADWFFAQEARPLPVRSWTGYGAVFLLWLGLRALALDGAAPAIAFLDNPAANAGTPARIRTAAAVQLDYLRLLLWPARLSVDHAYAETRVVESVLDVRVLGFLAILASAVAASLWARRRVPVLGLAVCGYAALFSITSNFLFPIGTIQAERLAYAPSAFFCLLVASAALPVAARAPRPLSVACGIGLVAVLGTLAFRQSRVFESEGALFRAAVAQAPASAKAHLQLAQALEEEGDDDGARGEYEDSARIYGDYGWTWFLLGNLCHRTGDPEAAVLAWRSALRADPGLVDVRANLASTLLELSRRSEAVLEARELFSRDPLHVRWPEIADRLAAGASAEERAAATREVESARAALARGEATAALAQAQAAVVSGALSRTERAEGLRLLSECWSRLGREAGARRFLEAARLLSAPGTPRDPGPR